MQLRNLRKSYGDLVIIDDLNLKVQDRDVFALVGPNGCGKTTLPKLISGLMKPDHGDIYIGGCCVG